VVEKYVNSSENTRGKTRFNLSHRMLFNVAPHPVERNFHLHLIRHLKLNGFGSFFRSVLESKFEIKSEKEGVEENFYYFSLQNPRLIFIKVHLDSCAIPKLVKFVTNWNIKSERSGEKKFNVWLRRLIENCVEKSSSYIHSQLTQPKRQIIALVVKEINNKPLKIKCTVKYILGSELILISQTLT
jgi:hypothetical protein